VPTAKLELEKATRAMERATAPDVTLQIHPMTFSCVGYVTTLGRSQ
jgi:hypothetical protein